MSERNNDGFVKETAGNRLYTYGDYLKWTDEKRYEIVDGQVHIMSPAPASVHQRILGEILRQISNYLFEKECEVYPAPFDVRFPEGEEKDEDILTVVQPDISVICDKTRLDNRGYRGAPELVIEIISLSTGDRDRKVKRELYEKHGVKEYWLVDYQEKKVEVYLSTDMIKRGNKLLDKRPDKAHNSDPEKCDKKKEKRFRAPVLYNERDMVSVNIFDDLKINLSYVFRD